MLAAFVNSGGAKRWPVGEQPRRADASANTAASRRVNMIVAAMRVG